MNFFLTEIKIKKIEKNEPFLGFAKIVINDAFCVKDIRILKGNDGDIRIVWPSRKRNKPADDGRGYEDICYPIKKSIGDEVRKKISELYKSGKSEFIIKDQGAGKKDERRKSDKPKPEPESKPEPGKPEAGAGTPAEPVAEKRPEPAGNTDP